MSKKPDIHFLDYRKLPIQHLVARCENQHGLILNHTMGTGKTFTGALFMANFLSPPFQHLVIGPANTRVEWIKTVQKVGVNNEHKLQFLPLDKDTVLDFVDQPTFRKNPEKFIVVVDEAHLLINILTDPSILLPKKKAVQYWLNQCKKLLLLTGTPFSSNPRDISFIVNIAAGKSVVPTTFAEFQKRYYKFNAKKAAISGWVAPILNKYAKISRPVLLPIWITYVLLIVVSLLFKYCFVIMVYHENLTRDELMDHIRETTKSLLVQIPTESVLTKAYVNERPPPNGHRIQHRISVGAYVNENASSTSNGQTTDSVQDKKDMQINDWLINVSKIPLVKEYGNSMSEHVLDFKKILCNLSDEDNYLYDDDDADEEDEEVTKNKKVHNCAVRFRSTFIKYPKTYKIFLKIGFPLVAQGFRIISAINTYNKFYLLLLSVYLMGLLIKKLEKIKDFYTLDTKAIVKDIAPYISTYNPFLLQNDPDILSHYPRSVEKIMYTRLTSTEMFLLYKVMMNRLSADELINFGFVASQEELEFFRPATEEIFYKNYGRLVGGIVTDKKLPQKFKYIFDMHRKNRQPTLIYSNFPGGLENFTKAAKNEGFTMQIIPTEGNDVAKKDQLIQDARNSQIDFLGLPHFATTGTDVPGMRVFHILEPCLDIITYKQLLARVVRYQHNTTEQYTVTIYTWVAKGPLATGKFAAFMKFWKQFGSHRAPWLFTSEIKQTTSPDSIAIEDLRKASLMYNNVQTEVMKLTNKESMDMSKELACCIYDPNNPCEKKSCQEHYKTVLANAKTSEGALDANKPTAKESIADASGTSEQPRNKKSGRKKAHSRDKKGRKKADSRNKKSGKKKAH